HRLTKEPEDLSVRLGQRRTRVGEAGRGTRIEPFVLSVHRGRDQVMPFQEPQVVVREGDGQVQSASQLTKMKPGIAGDKIVEVLPRLDRQDVLVLGRHAPLNAAAWTRRRGRGSRGRGHRTERTSAEGRSSAKRGKPSGPGPSGRRLRRRPRG